MGTAADMQIEENLALAYAAASAARFAPASRKSEREEYRKLLAELGLGLENAPVRQGGHCSRAASARR